jgi:hypothetical protein
VTVNRYGDEYVTEKATQNFLGIPIEGDIIRGEKKKDQRPMEEITPLFQTVLDQPEVLRFGWTQYTPYFNDGDPCIFGVNELWAVPVGTSEEDEDEERYHDEVTYDKENWGQRPWEWDNPRDWDNRKKVYFDYVGPAGREPAYNALIALNDALQSGEFDDALLNAFGDHAEIVVTADKIIVEQYEHD